MRDADCVAFLRAALPRLDLHCPGFRKVRKLVCKRLNRRLRELDLPGLGAYRAHLESHPGEWSALDELCRIPISRFWRDRGVFECIEREVLPDLAARAIARESSMLSCWSACCASGEEPYTLAILWHARLARRFPRIDLRHRALREVDLDVDLES